MPRLVRGIQWIARMNRAMTNWRKAVLRRARAP
ncbi:MAG: hypothetical protein RL477_1096 [Pseudomonadota bacterium]|jgi:hypothetical protein